MATLYEMTKQAAQLYEMLQAEEIDEQTFADTLEAIGTDEKVEAYCQIIKQLQSDVNMFTKEINRLKARKTTSENRIERMKQTLKNFLVQSGQTKVQAGTFTASMSQSSSVKILDIDKIPAEYLNPKPPEADKKALKKAIEDGKEIQGAEIIVKDNVRIR